MPHEKKVIAILGKSNSRLPRKTIISALMESASTLGISIDACWVENDQIVELDLHQIDGFFIAPGAPDEPHNHIVQAITFARENKIPLIATCGGFQRVVVEFLQQKIGYSGALSYQELDPNAQDPLFIQMSCQIQPEFHSVHIIANTRTEECYQKEQSFESFYCRFGVNPLYWPILNPHSIVIAGLDEKAIPRVIELNDHPFFIATLYVPQVLSSPGQPHPLLTGFLKATLT